MQLIHKCSESPSGQYYATCTPMENCFRCLPSYVFISCLCFYSDRATDTIRSSALSRRSSVLCLLGCIPISLSYVRSFCGWHPFPGPFPSPSQFSFPSLLETPFILQALTLRRSQVRQDNLNFDRSCFHRCGTFKRCDSDVYIVESSIFRGVKTGE